MPGYNAVVSLSEQKMLYKPEETAVLLSVSRRTVFRLISSGELDTVLIRSNRRIPLSSIDDYIKRHLVPANASASDR